jgi:hypothetical protein
VSARRCGQSCGWVTGSGVDRDRAFANLEKVIADLMGRSTSL